MLEHLNLSYCEVLSSLPNSFGDLANLQYLDLASCKSLKRFRRLHKIGNIESKDLLGSVEHRKFEVHGEIEEGGSQRKRLKCMGKLKKVEVRENKGSAIESCNETIQNWPDEMIICAGTVPDASSLVHSFKFGLSRNLSVVDSFSNKDLFSKPELYSPNSTAFMLCFIINGVSSLRLSSGR
ncbi:hypothetical protein SUGI_1128430 [Cryptomeria japonica]|nr:hypothetical protein SUGI_1128430 [Cryptomeria japonica]